MTEAAGRIVFFGATGYVGGLAVRELARAGARAVLAGRDQAALEELARELTELDGPGWETAAADLTDAGSLGRLIRPGDVVVSTAGPFTRIGSRLVMAVIEAGAVYIDVTGEAPFIRDLHEKYGPQAERTGATLIPSCAYGFLLGTLAGALALEEARTSAVGLEVAYFVGGGSLWPTASAGTLESIAAVFGPPGHTYRKGIVEQVRPQVRDFTLGAHVRPAATVGAAEHLALPRLYPDLLTIDVYVGMLGSATRALVKLPPLLLQTAGPAAFKHMARRARRRARRFERHPTLTARVMARARDASGLPLSEVHLSGADPYDFTSAMVAWCARRVLEHGTGGVVGAAGPTEAFGLDALQAGCAESGVSRLSG